MPAAFNIFRCRTSSSVTTCRRTLLSPISTSFNTTVWNISTVHKPRHLRLLPHPQLMHLLEQVSQLADFQVRFHSPVQAVAHRAYLQDALDLLPPSLDDREPGVVTDHVLQGVVHVGGEDPPTRFPLVTGSGLLQLRGQSLERSLVPVNLERSSDPFTERTECAWRKMTWWCRAGPFTNGRRSSSRIARP